MYISVSLLMHGFAQLKNDHSDFPHRSALLQTKHAESAEKLPKSSIYNGANGLGHKATTGFMDTDSPTLTQSFKVLNVFLVFA